MDISEYKNIYQHEQSHFFYVSTNYLVEKLIERYSPKRKDLKILDAGCGTGLLATRLTKYGQVETFDQSPEAIKWAKKRGLSPKKGSLTQIPYPDRSFDVVTCIDVLTHERVENKKQAVDELKRVLKKDGLLILRVAANSWLMTAHDELVMVTKRFDKNELEELLGSSDLQIRKISFVHSLLFPLLVGKYLFEKVLGSNPQTSVRKTPSWLNKLLTKLLIIEADWILDHNLPFGIGLIAVSQKD